MQRGQMGPALQPKYGPPPTLRGVHFPVCFERASPLRGLALPPSVVEPLGKEGGRVCWRESAGVREALNRPSRTAAKAPPLRDFHGSDPVAAQIWREVID